MMNIVSFTPICDENKCVVLQVCSHLGLRKKEGALYAQTAGLCGGLSTFVFVHNVLATCDAADIVPFALGVGGVVRMMVNRRSGLEGRLLEMMGRGADAVVHHVWGGEGDEALCRNLEQILGGQTQQDGGAEEQADGPPRGPLAAAVHGEVETGTGAAAEDAGVRTPAPETERSFLQGRIRRSSSEFSVSRL